MILPYKFDFSVGAEVFGSHFDHALGKLQEVSGVEDDKVQARPLLRQMRPEHFYLRFNLIEHHVI